jgi:hypothetical protein
VPLGESTGEQGAGQRLLAPATGGLPSPGTGPLDEPPPAGVAAPEPTGRLPAGFWPVPCLLVADEGGARLHIAVSAGTTVHAIVPANVRTSHEPVIEIEALDGRRFRYSPVADIRVAAGDDVNAGAVLGTVAGVKAAKLELSVREADGRWVDPYPLLVGLADPNELGVDARTGDGVDPDDIPRRTAPPPRPVTMPPPTEAVPAVATAPATPAPAPAAALPPPVAPAATQASPDEPASAADAAEARPPDEAVPEKPPAPRVTSDILAAMIAPTPPPHAEHDDD